MRTGLPCVLPSCRHFTPLVIDSRLLVQYQIGGLDGSLLAHAGYWKELDPILALDLVQVVCFDAAWKQDALFSGRFNNLSPIAILILLKSILP